MIFNCKRNGKWSSVNEYECGALNIIAALLITFDMLARNLPR